MTRVVMCKSRPRPRCATYSCRCWSVLVPPSISSVTALAAYRSYNFDSHIGELNRLKSSAINTSPPRSKMGNCGKENLVRIHQVLCIAFPSRLLITFFCFQYRFRFCMPGSVGEAVGSKKGRVKRSLLRSIWEFRRPPARAPVRPPASPRAHAPARAPAK